MTWLYVVVALLVVGAAVVVAAGRWDHLPDVEPDLRPDAGDGQPAFDVVVRGYRMDEVDARIETMQAEIDRLSGRSSE